MEQLFKVSSPCLDDHLFKKEELESVGELSKVCSQMVLKCLYLARIGTPDIRQGDGPQGGPSTGSGGPARVPNLRVCKHPGARWHTHREMGEKHALPWNCPVGVVSTSSETRKGRAARKGKWSPRGTGTTVLTYPGMRPGNRQGR